MKKHTMNVIFVACILLLLLVPPAYSASPAYRESDADHSNPLVDYRDITTIQDMVLLMEEYLESLSLPPRLHLLFSRSISRGLHQLDTVGIHPSMTIKDTSTMLTPNHVPLALQKSRLFLVSSYPDMVDMNLTIPPFEQNESEENVSIEIFIKLYPVVDYVMCEKEWIIRTFCQETSLLWPAIGGRVIKEDETSFIMAFGPGIRWSWRLF